MRDRLGLVFWGLTLLAALGPSRPAGGRPIDTKFECAFDAAGDTQQLAADDSDDGKGRGVAGAGGERPAAGKGQRVLLDFEDPAEAKLVRAEEADLKLSLSDQHASTGGHSLRMEAAKGKDYVAFQFDPSLLKGWEAYDYLAMDFYSDDEAFMTLTPELWDRATKNYQTRATLEKGVRPLHPGKTRVLIDLRRAVRNGKADLETSDLRPQDYVDRAALTRFKAWFVTAGHARDYVCYLDNVRLLQEGALEGGMKVTLPAGAKAFAFGAGRPAVGGFSGVGPAEVYGREKGYGFVRPAGLRAEGRDWPDPLTGQYVGGGHKGYEGAWAPADFEFRVDVPDGKYLVWLSAGYFPSPGLRHGLEVNGKRMYDVEMTWEKFYSRDGFYRFFDADYSEKPGALWTNYVSKIAPAHVLETTVTNGAFVVKGENSFIAALVLAPAEQRASFDAMARQIESERMRCFHDKAYLQRPKNEPCAATDPKLLLFAPGPAREVMPWVGMGARDAREARLAVTPGEATAFQVALRPFADLGRTELSVGDFRGPGGSVIPRSAVTIWRKNYLSDGNTVHPWCLVRTSVVDLESGLTRAFWLRARVPADAAPGSYTGAVTATTAAGEARSLPVTLEVFPFKLADNVPVAFGLYYDAPDGGQFACYQQFKEAGQRRDRLLSEQMELLRDFGLTSVQLAAPAVTSAGGGGCGLDFSAPAKVAAAARAAGMAANPRQALILSTLGPARAIGRRLGGKDVPGRELRLPGFDAAFVSAVRQMVDWAKAAGVPLLLWVVDEPREFPNPWNRNLADTLEYCDLAHRAPGARVMVTPMGDRQNGKDYLPLLDHLDVVSTHPTAHSTRMIEKAINSGGGLGLHLYNGGKDRLSNGFYVWRVGASGKWEWHFNQWVGEPTPGGYLGREQHNPFLNYELTGATAPAPIGYRGGVAPMEGLFTMSLGINDYRYVYTLERALAEAKREANEETKREARQPGRAGRAAAVESAEALLKEMREAIPLTPDVAGYEDPARLADVGRGIKGGAAGRADEFRRRCAEAIVRLRG